MSNKLIDDFAKRNQQNREFMKTPKILFPFILLFLLGFASNFQKIFPVWGGQGGTILQLEVDRDRMPGKTDAEITQAVDQTAEILRNRLKVLGLSRAQVDRKGISGIQLILPSSLNIQKTEDLILADSLMEYRLISERYKLSDYMGVDGKVNARMLPKDITYFPNYQRKGNPVGYLCEAPLLTGADLADAKAGKDNHGRPIVSLQFTEWGANKLSMMTGQNINRQMAIVLARMVYSAPKILTKLTGRTAIFTGSFSEEEARYLALILTSGTITTPLRVVSESQQTPNH
jgi:preprotein translocase subunit SecD